MTEHGVNGRVIIVTGAGRGIGRGIVRHLAKNGATLKQQVDSFLSEIRAG